MGLFLNTELVMIMFKVMIEGIICFYIYRLYRRHFNQSKWKLGFIGACIFMIGTILSIITKTPLLNTEEINPNSIRVNIEIIGILIMAVGFYKMIMELINVSNVDYLTQTHTRKYIDELLQVEKRHCMEVDSFFSIIFIDINDFKDVNDTYGHENGNYVLTETAKVLKESVRKGDKVGRYGGDEFIVILHDTNNEVANEVLERCRLSVKMNKLLHQYSLSISGGVSTYPNDSDNILNLCEIADMRMYEDKERRNDRGIL